MWFVRVLLRLRVAGRRFGVLGLRFGCLLNRFRVRLENLRGLNLRLRFFGDRFGLLGSRFGRCSIVTDNRKPVAMIGPLPKTPLESGNSSQPSAKTKPLSDAAAFRRALLAARRPIDLDF